MTTEQLEKHADDYSIIAEVNYFDLLEEINNREKRTELYKGFCAFLEGIYLD